MTRWWTLLLVGTLIGCDAPVKEYASVIHVDPRWLVKSIPATPGGHAVGNALIGGLLAGTVGAIIGVAATEDARAAHAEIELVRCVLTVRRSSGEVRRAKPETGYGLQACSVLLPGDSTPLEVWPSGQVMWAWNTPTWIVP